MKILVAYNRSAWRGNGYTDLEKYFNQNGHEGIAYDLAQSPYHTNLYQKLPFYFPKGWPVRVQSLLKKQQPFDAVVEVDGTGQYHLCGLRSFGGPKILWSHDAHVYAKRQFQIYIQNDFDKVLVCHRNYCRYFHPGKTDWLPLGFSPTLHRNLHLRKQYDIVFVGNMDPHLYPERGRIVALLKQHFNVGAFHRLYHEKMVEAMNSGRIVLNKSLNGDLNLRVFETLGMGQFLLTDKIENGLLDLFEDGKHLVTYSSDQDLLEKATYYLQHEEEREKIAQSGYQEALQHHDFFQRAKTIIALLETIRQQK